MNETDMELQAIRQKLQTLKSEGTPAASPAPWLPPRQTPSSTHLAQVTAAIESLKQQQPTAPQAAPLPPQPLTPQPVPPPDTEWIGQVASQCEGHLAHVNDLGQQQGMALLQLKQYLDQVELEFQRRGWDTPAEVDAALQFLVDLDSFGIPLIERSHQGQLQLHYHTVDVYQAEHEAMTTAQALRQSYSDYDREYGDALGPVIGEWGANWLVGIQQALQQGWERCQSLLRPATAPPGRPVRQSPFTLMDGLIWFSGAAIVRALLNVVFQFYPALWTPLVVLLLGCAAISLHRMLVGPRRPEGLSYRLFVLVLGFIIGGQFG